MRSTACGSDQATLTPTAYVMLREADVHLVNAVGVVVADGGGSGSGGAAEGGSDDRVWGSKDRPHHPRRARPRSC